MLLQPYFSSELLAERGLFGRLRSGPAAPLFFERALGQASRQRKLGARDFVEAAQLLEHFHADARAVARPHVADVDRRLDCDLEHFARRRAGCKRARNLALELIQFAHAEELRERDEQTRALVESPSREQSAVRELQPDARVMLIDPVPPVDFIQKIIRPQPQAVLDRRGAVFLLELFDSLSCLCATIPGACSSFPCALLIIDPASAAVQLGPNGAQSRWYSCAGPPDFLSRLNRSLW